MTTFVNPWQIYFEACQKMTNEAIALAKIPLIERRKISREGVDAPKQKVCRLGALSFPLPLTQEPEVGTMYWWADVSNYAVQKTQRWSASSEDRTRLRHGLCHLSEGPAAAQVRALLAINKSAITHSK